MKHARFFFIFLFCVLVSTPVMSSGRAADDASTAEAKQQYRAYLEQLKELSKQYKQVTGEMKEVIKEEGVPVWDENEGGIKMKHDVDFSSPVTPTAGAAPGVSLRQTDKHILADVEMPGVKKESIRVSLLDNKLVKVTAQRKSGEKIERVVTLPGLASDKNTKAGYEDGVLSIQLEKLPYSQKEVAVPIQ